MASEKSWERFCADAAAVMRQARENKITLEEASAFFEKSDAISNPDLGDYVGAIIWEIDGSPGYYDDLVELFDSHVSEEEMVQQLRLNDTLAQRFWLAVCFWRKT